MNEFLSISEEETKRIASQLAEQLNGDEVILIYGSLASGKTVFVKGLARGLGIDENLVSSPTFTIMNIYAGKSLLFHLDLYRLEDPGEMDFLGIEDFLGMGVLAVEWGEKAEKAPWAKNAIRVYLEQISEKERKIKVMF